jgi:hypothetical protein
MRVPVIPSAARNPEATERSSCNRSGFLAALGMTPIGERGIPRDLPRRLTRLGMTAALTVLTACGIRSPIRQQVTLDFNEPEKVRVTATTSIDDKLVNTEDMRRRVADVRDALANSRDEWSARFAPLEPMVERTIIDKASGSIVRTEHTVTIPRAQLQRVFADTNITIEATSGDGYAELAIYPGTSTRATRQQREAVESTLHAWTVDAARYLRAMHHLYSYLDAHPQRAKYVFTRMLDNEDAPVLEEEQGLVEGVGRASDALTERLRSAEQNAVSIDEQFDRVFNPLPAEIFVKLPSLPTARDGFVSKDQLETIPHRGLIDALEALNGRWLSPDPLMLLQTRNDNDPELTPDALAAMPRHSTPDVNASEIEAAVIEQLKPANTYRLRWVEAK